MKRFVWLLALCLILTASSALAENRDVFPVETEDQVFHSGMALVDGQLLLMRNDGLYAYTPGQPEAELVMPQDIAAMVNMEEETKRFDVLLADAGQVYAFDLMAGRLYPATVAEGQVTLGERIQLDLSDMVEEHDNFTFMSERPEGMLLHNGRLYMLTRNYRDGSGASQLICFDLASGERTTFQTPHIAHIASYKDGKLLAVLFDTENGYDERTGKVRPAMLAVFDPESDTAADLGLLTDSEGADGLLGYDAEKDIIYTARHGKLYRRTAQDMTQDELVGYVPSNQFWGVVSGSIIALEDGVAVLTGNNLYIRDADPAKLPAHTLTVYGNYGDTAHRAAQALMPEVPVLLRDREYFGSAQELGQALVSGENTIDVYFLDYSFIDVMNLMKKGYAHDLSGSQRLQEHVDKLYPMFKEAGMLDGKLLMVPVETSIGNTLTAFSSRFEQTGLTIPQTYAQLIELVAAWPDTYAEQYPDMKPLQTEDYRRELMYLGMELYQNLRAYQGQELHYDDPLFRKMMAAMDQLDTRDLDQVVDYSSMEDMEAFFSQEPLLMQSGGMQPSSFQYAPKEQRLVMLAADEGEPAPVPVMLRLAAINPRSANIDLALQYLENYVASLSAEMQVMLMPGCNDPVLNPQYDQIMEQINATVQAYEDMLRKAEDAARAEMESVLAEIKKSRDMMAEESRYLFGEQAIQTYRDLMNTAFLKPYDPANFGGTGDMYNLYDRYLQKQIDLDTFIREADGKLRLMRLENQ